MRRRIIFFSLVIFMVMIRTSYVQYRQNMQKSEVLSATTAEPVASATPEVSVTPSTALEASPSATPIATKSSSISERNTRAFFSGPNSPFGQKISSSATLTKESRITSLRPAYEAWAMPIYRISSKDNVPTVELYNDWGRKNSWPIPKNAKPASGDDGQIGVLDTSKGIIYEMGSMKWEGENKIHVGGMKDFALSGNGVSNPANQRVTAAGFAVSAGMLVREDFLNADGKFTKEPHIAHALTMALPHQILKRNAFIAPAVGGDDNSDNTGDIPLGTRYALPQDADIDSMELHPLTRSIARSLKEYGVYVNDRNDAKQHNGGYVGNIRVEVGLLQSVYDTPNDTLLITVQKEMGDVIAKYSLYKVEEK